jgi:nicotinamidase-related amidase
MPKLNAKPEPLEVDFQKSAIVVVDRQNASASRGGMPPLAGADLTDAPRVADAIHATIEKARAAFFLDYRPILLRDACMAAGSPALREATFFNVESCFGWTMNAEDPLSHLNSRTG